MSGSFAELGHESTPLGDLSLRRRRIAALDRDVFEVKLGDEYLMSSLFTESEEELGRMGVAAVEEQGRKVDVVVGGLGLGYTAAAVLGSDAVGSLVVVELFRAVIDWHERGVVPIGRRVSGDPRCRLVHDDFFARAASDEGLDPEVPRRRWDAILVDIDHSPEELLDPDNAGFYEPAGLEKVRAQLHEGGVFGLWSDKPPADTFTARLANVFSRAEARPVTFPNPLIGGTYTQTVYLAWG